MLIASDSVVALPPTTAGGRWSVLEKPPTRAAAHGMLTALSGATHVVHTAVVLVSRDPPHAACGRLFAATPVAAADGVHVHVHEFVSSSHVTFARLPPSVVDAYVDTASPYDKAGGYGLQGDGAQFASRVEGDPSTVVGLPLFDTCAALRDWAVGGGRGG